MKIFDNVEQFIAAYKLEISSDVVQNVAVIVDSDQYDKIYKYFWYAKYNDNNINNILRKLYKQIYVYNVLDIDAMIISRCAKIELPITKEIWRRLLPPTEFIRMYHTIDFDNDFDVIENVVCLLFPDIPGMLDAMNKFRRNLLYNDTCTDNILKNMNMCLSTSLISKYLHKMNRDNK